MLRFLINIAYWHFLCPPTSKRLRGHITSGLSTQADVRPFDTLSDHTLISPFSIQDGQFSVTGERMGTLYWFTAKEV